MATYDSETALVNSALVKIGEDRITSLSADTSRRAVIANQQYPIVRDALLCRHRWNFALARATLAQDATAPEFGFTYRYALPDDFLHFVGLYDENESAANYTATETIHKVEGQYVLLDEVEAQCVYIQRVTNTTLFHPLFGEALAWALAADLAYHLSQGPGNANRCNAVFEKKLKEAKIAGAFQGTPEIIEASSWVDSRGGSTYGRGRGPFYWV